MNKSNHLKRACALISSVAVGLCMAGCSSVRSAPPGVRTELRSAAGVQLESVRLATTDRGLMVSGSVSRRIGYASSPRRHLDIEIVAEDGAVLARTATNFIPNPIRHSPRWRMNSEYAITIPQLPPAGSVVRVTVHATSLSNCRN